MRYISILLFGGLILLSGNGMAEIVNGDFESGNYQNWQLKGTAFGNVPAAVRHAGLVDWEGGYWGDSIIGGETSTGTLVSEPFVIMKSRLSFLKAGWDKPDASGRNNFYQLKRISDGMILRTSRPPMKDPFVLETWDVSDLKGDQVEFVAVDMNTDNAFAWLAVDAVHEHEPGEFSYSRTEACGIPFLTLKYQHSMVPDKGIVKLPVGGIKGKRLFLLGGTNSFDIGNPCWTPCTARSIRYFLGTKIGSIQIAFEDGTIDTVPLIFGYNIWWYSHPYLQGFKAPFDTSKGKILLAETLHLKETGLPNPRVFVMAVSLSGKAIREIQVKDEAGKDGVPVFCGATLEPEDSATCLGLLKSKPPETLSAFKTSLEMDNWLKYHTLDPGESADEIDDDIVPLRQVLYNSFAMIENRPVPPLDIPPGYQGPRIRFEGDVYAAIFTNMFYHNVQDILDKTSDGTYHTSTRGAPSWGGYEGFGTWKEGVGSYYDHAWTRDFGRALTELVQLGYQQRAENLSKWAWKCARWYNENGVTYPDGTLAPVHWPRVCNLPDNRGLNVIPQGNPENDGHGLLMLATSKTCERSSDKKRWAKENWHDIKAAAEWICWQFENPQLSGAIDILQTDSECSGGRGNSVYADFLCMMGLRSHARIARSIGENISADRWEARAALMQSALLSSYTTSNPEYGTIWKNPGTWAGHYPMLAPLMISGDYLGFDSSLFAQEWKIINMNSYKWQLNEHKGQPRNFHGVAMGYGQCFITQCALLLDQMDDASLLIQTLAAFTYFPGHKPFIIPEGCEWTDDGQYWHRTGDLGNGVQEAEGVKVMRLIVGVDDTGRLKIMPRLPETWRKISISDYLVRTDSGTAVLDMTYKKSGDVKMECKLKATNLASTFDIRMGSFPMKTSKEDLAVKVNGVSFPFEFIQSGDRKWAWLRNIGSDSRWIITTESKSALEGNVE